MQVWVCLPLDNKNLDLKTVFTCVIFVLYLNLFDEHLIVTNMQKK